MVDIIINNKNFPDLALMLGKNSSTPGFKGNALNSDPKPDDQWSMEKQEYLLVFLSH